MNRHVTMPLLETIVLLDVMQVVTADDDSPLHFHLLDNASKNSSTNGHITSEGAFLVNVGSLNSLKRYLD